MRDYKLKHRRIASRLTRIAISIDFDNLLAHCDFLTKGLALERERFDRFVERETKNLDDEDHEFFMGFHSDQRWRIHDVFPSLQATSAFLLAYGLFEKTLNEIAKEAGDAVGTQLKLADLHGQGIDRAKNFLSKVCGVTAPFATQDWSRIVEISKVRNVMAHAFGVLDLSKPDHKHVLRHAAQHETIKVTRHSAENNFAEIELTLGYVVAVVKCFRKFLIDLCNCKIEPAAE